MYALPKIFIHNIIIIKRIYALIFQKSLNVKFIKKKAIKKLDKMPGKLTNA